MKIIIGAVISLSPYSPGTAWDRLQYAAGFQKLGHDVYYIEEVKPEWCVDSQGERCDFEHSVNRDLFRVSMERVGLMERACQIYNQGEATFGLSLNSLIALSKDADVLINITGEVKTEPVLSNIKRRVYLDQDPVYTQLWYAEYGKDLNFKMHDIFFSVGLNIGTPYTTIPDCGVEWRHTLPPVVLEHWPFHIDPSCRRFTTIASWGWFGDRAAHYLASGKPVLAQSTGLERCLPTGKGLITFSNIEEAVAGIEAINRDYEVHCRAAREFAEEYLDYRKVLPEMLEFCMA